MFNINNENTRTKLKFYPFGENWDLIFMFGSVGPKSKNVDKFNFLDLLMLNETILEMSYFKLNFGKNKLFLGGRGGSLELISIFGFTGPKFKNKKLKHVFLRVLNALVAFSYPGEANFDKKHFLNMFFV